LYNPYWWWWPSRQKCLVKYGLQTYISPSIEHMVDGDFNTTSAFITGFLFVENGSGSQAVSILESLSVRVIPCIGWLYH